nr:MAG TPA: hypothetical protein [Caudoviricetes sp.]
MGTGNNRRLRCRPVQIVALYRCRCLLSDLVSLFDINTSVAVLLVRVGRF